MFGTGNCTLPLNKAQGNDMQLQTDVKMKVISEYTEVISSSDADKIIEYEIITVKELEDRTFTNLENCIPNDLYNDKDPISRYQMSIEDASLTNYTDQIVADGTYYKNSQDSTSRCKMSVEELSHSCNTNHVLKVENKNSSLDHLIECMIDNTCEENKQHIEAEVSLDDAFRQCLTEINSDLSDDNYNFDNILKQLNDNGSSTETNHKRKISLSDELIVTEIDNDNNSNCTCGYNENTKKKRIDDGMIDISEESNLKPCEEIHHDIFYEETESEIEYLKKTNKRFLQKCICLNLPPTIDKCIECRIYQMKNNLTKREYDSIACRFYAFRQLRFQKSGLLSVAGYPDPFKNMEQTDFSMWLPKKHVSDPCGFNIQASTKILEDAGSQFCMFVKDEIDALKLNLPYNGKPRKILWKKCVKGIREMCDVCRTTIFNHHWSCRKCGFVVCVDCFKTKLKDTTLTENQTIVQSDFNSKDWLLCSNEKEHHIEKLFITQILAGDALKRISDLMHETCNNRNIPLDCSCNDKLEKILPLNSTDPIFDDLINIYEQPNYVNKSDKEDLNLKHLIDTQHDEYLEFGDDDSSKGSGEFLSEDESEVTSEVESEVTSEVESEVISELEFEVASEFEFEVTSEYEFEVTSEYEFEVTSEYEFEVESEVTSDVKSEIKCEVTSEIKSEVKSEIKSEVKSEIKSELKSEIKCEVTSEIKSEIKDAVEHIKTKEWFPPKLSLLSDDKTNAPHMWLCEGHLLRLLDPKSDINYTIFQEQWKRGQPVLVSDVGNKLNSSLWHPKSFSRDFGHQINDLIDCTTGNVISDQPMSKFWNGFENSEERLCDKMGNVMLLKLKDWPPSADFAETLPSRFQDLMNCLPLKEYTHRNGKYNLASRLPDCYVRPDLGPKMYTAYGNAGTKHKQVGTTNLHLDISDAVNVMVYVAITKNCKEYDYDWHVKKALQVIEEAGCDDLTLRRIYEHGETPGALWHIYHASDADSIRDLLIKVAVEHGTPLEEFSDPIHDQSHYLDEYLRERLYREYGVKGYAIVQYYGDAVFIPAGAPHQVRNLHNCIKVAEDFVSPENVHHSFRMTQQFRHLTDSHTNHEDKLQIKNIVFHAVKDSISVLMHSSHDRCTNV